jgi:hypothetical protein
MDYNTEGRSKEPNQANHTTARKPGRLLYIKYSLFRSYKIRPPPKHFSVSNTSVRV